MSSPPSDAGTDATVTVRPWPLFIDTAALSLPISFSDATYRINKNLRYFVGNYAIIILSILLISLIFRPVSLVLFLIIFAGWIYLYFSRNEPLELFGFDVDDKFVLGFLTLVTFVALLVAKIWTNIIISIGVGIVILCVHGALRAPEDQEDSPYVALPVKTAFVVYLVHDMDVNDCLDVKVWLTISFKVGSFRVRWNYSWWSFISSKLSAGHFKIVYTFRENNKVADSLTNFSSDSQFDYRFSSTADLPQLIKVKYTGFVSDSGHPI
ncbi:hypothetical protein HAX54_011798 [Datura stramonium]|uniref:PRA1 family protein n=1 Tax=Datura stramonium TaxID=4076 RepID=A0ABS8TKF6_DATST|nr:hypothetical protein [Datura stramonium]